MVGQTGEIEVAARRLLKPGENDPLKLARAAGGQRLLDGEPSELVSKRDCLRRRGEHPRAHAGVDVFRIRFCLEQPELGLRMRDRDELERSARRRRELGDACENRVPNRRRNPLLPRQEHLGDEERVAAGRGEEVACVDVVRLGQLCDRGGRQRLQRHAVDRSRRRHVSENHSQWVTDLELAPVGRYDERADAHDPASE